MIFNRSHVIVFFLLFCINDWFKCIPNISYYFVVLRPKGQVLVFVLLKLTKKRKRYQEKMVERH